MRFICYRSVIATFLVYVTLAVPVGRAERWTVKENDGRLIIADEHPVAEYVFRDEKTLRPYFAQVRTPSGIQVTRNHPPKEGIDIADHETMHPGIWFALSSLSGGDFWRNKDRVEFVRWIQPPTARDDGVAFQAEFQYRKGERVIARETSKIQWTRHGDSAYRVRWSVRLVGDEDLIFGDVEEQGLGLRVATPLAVKKGGTLRNSQGLTGESQLWGKVAEWCVAEGTVDQARVGILLKPTPLVDHAYRFHARDYGMMTANPFGEKSFTGKGDGSFRVPAGEPIDFTFDVLVYDGWQGEKLLMLKSADRAID